MINVPSMPFYWRVKANSGVAINEPPQRFPFKFDYDATLNLVIEHRSKELTDLLSDIYSRNVNVGFLQDGHSLANSYGADFWRFLSDLLVEYPSRTILEVGCGGCVLLERLKAQGYRVVGIDPSPFAAEAGYQKGIEVIQEYFSVGSFDFSPDLIFQVDVLEHIEDPVSFLTAQAECLNDNGLIVVNVPDCTHSIERGDISMALHQHVNMFDRISLPTVFKAAGLEVVKIERSLYGSALYCVGRKCCATDDLNSKKDNNVDSNRWKKFELLADSAIRNFQSKIEESRQKGKSIGFFMPQRAFPYLGTINWFDGFRIFDNSNMWHHKYLDGIDVFVENQVDLISHPVDHIFIMSLTFGNEVADALSNAIPDMTITTLNEILK